MLTVLRLNLTHADARTESRAIHRIHGRVNALTDGLPPPPGGRVLWAQPRRDILLIQTGTQLPLGRLPEGYVTGHSTTPALPPSLAPGDAAVFAVIGNPTRRPTRPRGEGGTRPPDKRIPIPLSDRDRWLAGKLAGVLTITRLSGQDLGVRRGYSHTGDAVTCLWHAWQGEGIVDDPGALGRLVAAGIGPAKGYGCGLLVIRQAEAAS